MTDQGDTAIVVTVPKSQQDHVLNEKFKFKGPGYIWWSLPRFPRRPVDRIYFVWAGAIRAWRYVLGFDHEGEERKPAAMIGLAHHVVDPPVPMKGFQGFRYYEPKAEAQVRAVSSTEPQDDAFPKGLTPEQEAVLKEREAEAAGEPPEPVDDDERHADPGDLDDHWNADQDGRDTEGGGEG